MATTAKIIGNKKRRALTEKFAAVRAAAKKALIAQASTAADKEKAMKTLQSLPRNSSRVRIRNRCEITGRQRGYLRKFKMSRIALRHYGLRGDIPGLIKSSW